MNAEECKSLLVNPRASECALGRVSGKAAGAPDSGVVGGDEDDAGRRSGIAQPGYEGSPVSSNVAQPSVGDLLMRIEELTRRVEWLEAGRPGGGQVPIAIPPDVVLVISAAVAAYLGHRAKVRQIRLAGSAIWLQQGRESIMRSHAVVRGPSGRGGALNVEG